MATASVWAWRAVRILIALFVLGFFGTALSKLTQGLTLAALAVVIVGTIYMALGYVAAVMQRDARE